jgi:hypothetical protein
VIVRDDLLVRVLAALLCLLLAKSVIAGLVGLVRHLRHR